MRAGTRTRAPPRGDSRCPHRGAESFRRGVRAGVEFVLHRGHRDITRVTLAAAEAMDSSALFVQLARERCTLLYRVSLHPPPSRTTSPYPVVQAGTLDGCPRVCVRASTLFRASAVLTMIVYFRADGERERERRAGLSMRFALNRCVEQSMRARKITGGLTDLGQGRGKKFC